VLPKILVTFAPIALIVALRAVMVSLSELVATPETMMKVPFSADPPTVVVHVHVPVAASLGST